MKKWGDTAANPERLSPEGDKPMANVDDICGSSDRNPSLNRIVKERAKGGVERMARSGESQANSRESVGENSNSARQQQNDNVSWQNRQIARAVETEIIPRLLLSHIAAPKIQPNRREAASSNTMAAINHAELEAFADIIIHRSLKAGTEFIDSLLASGMTLEAMIVDVLSTTARHLGELWDEDRITFVDVSLGLSRLQQLLRVYGPAFEAEFAPKAEGHRILLAAMPGEQHTFGMSVVEEFFRRDGWDVQSETSISRAELLNRAQQEHFDVIGISASADASVNLLAPLIRACRDVSMNREVRVIVGGCSFLAKPENALALGADLVACNGKEAILNVERLLDPKKSEAFQTEK
jgi:MerR family transcriptional regulator, light-induced transcriptional regulator